MRFHNEGYIALTMRFVQAMRWFGSSDAVSLSSIRQAGCEEVVTALHQVNCGEIWPLDQIVAHKQCVSDAGLNWAVVESLPVHESIKTDSTDCKIYLKRYCESLENLARAGLTTVCYNFMPLLDWTRTSIDKELQDGSKALEFDWIDLIIFDLEILQRAGADSAYTGEEKKNAAARFEQMTSKQKARLEKAVLMGLPGTVDSFNATHFRSLLNTYASIEHAQMRANLVRFLEAIIPTAEQCGIEMAIHPDDPPRSLFGLPRVVSTYVDLQELFESVPSKNNGLTFCSGSLGARKENDLNAIVKDFSDRIYFVHLRNVKHTQENSFFESDHLDGNIDLAEIMRTFKTIPESQIKTKITLRPDHGHQMLDDLEKNTYPGYSAVGRLRGLAELRGLERGIDLMMQ